MLSTVIGLYTPLAGEVIMVVVLCNLCQRIDKVFEPMFDSSCGEDSLLVENIVVICDAHTGNRTYESSLILQ